MRRFFNAESIWNQPVDAKAETDPQSTAILQFMHRRDPRGLWINLERWTIPIYEVDATTPRRKVFRRLTPQSKWLQQRSAAYLHENHPLGHGPGFAEDAAAGQIPIPDYAQSDPESDGHMALVDWEQGWIWDMWAARRRADGQWESNTGMKYRADGSGVFDRNLFPVHNGESVHPYGPGRAAGVPILAGTIMHQEIQEGRIAHKLAFATQAAGLQRFVYPPACWTDGGWKGGVPEGAVLQLAPALKLEAMGLSGGALIVGKALQEYGAVCVDVAGGHVLYGQGLYADPQKRNWQGLLNGDDLVKIGLEHYRILKMDNMVYEGMGERVPDGRYAGEDQA